jgi:hypothetical protein
VAEKNRTKGEARLRFFVARAAEGGEAYTDLLSDGKISPKHLPWTAGGSIIPIHLLFCIYPLTHFIL